MISDYKITNYENRYENSWLRCRVLSFLDSAYYDDVHTEKEQYKNPTIDLIAVHKEQVIGFLDMEYEVEPNTVCNKVESLGEHLAGMIWHLGVHPDFRKQGIAKALLDKAVQLAKEKELKRLEAWTRDDVFVNDWYTKNEFVLSDEYIHWYFNDHHDDHALLNKILQVEGNMKSISRIFGQARQMTDDISQLKRKYYCRRFDKVL